MKLSKIMLLGLVCLAVFYSAQAAEEEYVDEEEAPLEVAPAPKPVARHNPLLRNRAGPRNAGPAKPAATTTTAAPVPKEEAEDLSEDPQEGAEDNGDQQDGEDIPATTETTKRGLKTGVVRPFRSNDDLLAALKRRRQEAKNGKSHHDEHAAPAPVREDAEAEVKPTKPPKSGNLNGRRRFSAPAKSEPAPIGEESNQSSASVKPSRSRFNTRTAPKTQTVDDIAGSESNQEQVEVKPKSNYRNSRRIQ